MTQAHAANRLVLVTGPSGAGRSSAIRALEDMGYEAIDNLPLSLLPRLLDGPVPDKPMALGVDTRNRDFSTNALIEVIDSMGGLSPVPMQVLYLDCSADVLLRRFSETRRRHPLAPAETPDIGIAREFDLLVPIRARADHLIDTSEMSPHDLRTELELWFSARKGSDLSVSVQSFSYKRGLPRGLDMVLDCRFLRNPYWEESLRSLDGRVDAVASYIREDERFEPFRAKVLDLAGCCCPPTRPKARLTSRSDLAAPAGSIAASQWQKHWPKPLQRAAGRCQLGIANWSGGQRNPPGRSRAVTPWGTTKE